MMILEVYLKIKTLLQNAPTLLKNKRGKRQFSKNRRGVEFTLGKLGD